MFIKQIEFPEFTGVRCLMMPFIQGEPSSVPDEYQAYSEILRTSFFKKGDIGYLTIDESVVLKDTPHRGTRAKTNRALHTEVGRLPNKIYAWGSGGGWGSGIVGESNVWGSGQSVGVWGSTQSNVWGGLPKGGVWGGGWGRSHLVTLDGDVEIYLANNLTDSCALWNAEHRDTSLDGDIGYAADQYPYEDAIMMKAGELHKIGIFTPHESLPVKQTFNRQFLRIISSGVHGREPYFTANPLGIEPES